MSPLQWASIKYLPQIISCSYWGLPDPLRRLFSLWAWMGNPKWAQWLGPLSHIWKSITPEMDLMSHFTVNATSTGSYMQPTQACAPSNTFPACLFVVTIRVWEELCTNVQHIFCGWLWIYFLFLFGSLFRLSCFFGKAQQVGEDGGVDQLWNRNTVVYTTGHRFFCATSSKNYRTCLEEGITSCGSNIFICILLLRSLLFQI